MQTIVLASDHFLRESVEVGVSFGGDHRKELFRHFGVLFRLEREVQLLEREPVDVTVDRISRVVGGRVGEARFHQTSDRRVYIAQHRRVDIGA